MPQVLCNDVHLRAKLGGSDARLEAREDADVATFAGSLGDEREGRPNVGRAAVRKISRRRDRRKAARHDADERVRLTAQKHFLTDLRGIGTKSASPEAIANDGHALAVAAVIVLRKVTSEKRAD